MTLFLLRLSALERTPPVILCPPGHNGAGSTSVAGVCGTTRPLHRKDQTTTINDYGLQLGKTGLCDGVIRTAGAFGERREDPEDTRRLPDGLKGDCYRLAHMGEPLGIPVLGMLTLGPGKTHRLAGRGPALQHRPSGGRGVFRRRDADVCG